ncbi:type IVB secretion system protein IcmH/DotU [Sediminicurvatus halobius]|uniref:Type VI secretion system protein TssL n=1 Tax=Sediminicurvatus halobius TaxID=2182432 RepID=A0A2U2N226_9GAMM|nr:type IVB secretion system protein IcmH/DotU [Spiribacter halobius]PWG63271.1 type VI secretion system protein TssL [Spiribacter halobius]UEX76656.1 type IVB secretion system protein IcmH/DotU [Spiribacter halobius]
MSGSRQPPDPGDRTVIRPDPGGRRRADSGSAEAPAPPPRPASGPRAEPAPDDLTAVLGIGPNPLVEAAAPLLLLATGVRRSRQHPDVSGLHERVLRQVTEFERQATAAGVTSEVVLAARYALCTFIDEMVMNTPWGAHSTWAGRPLLLELHKDTGGGEKFFQMVERVLADREPKRDLIEFFYVCLALGFEGKYRIAETGRNALAETRERLYARIRGWRGDVPQELSPRWQGVQDRRYRLVRGVPAWVFLSAAAVVAGGAFVTFQSLLGGAVSPVMAQLNQIQQATFESPSGTAVQAGPSLAELLEGSHPERLRIEPGEDGGTRLTLVGEVFRSGSVSVREPYLAVLDDVAAAIRRVPGQVLVVGHTDDVPIRSLEIKDNYELSRLRARGAAERLQAGLADPGRISVMGAGPDQPRYRPVDTPENRARNRRIEIIHRPGGAAP